MATVTITKGLPASGKSTWAKEQVEKNGNIRRVNKDLLRGMLGGKHNKRIEKIVEKARDAAILAALAEGFDVIVDDTNLAPRHEAHLRDITRGKAEFLVNDSFLSVTVEECITRDRARATSVGKDVIERMHRDLHKPNIPTKRGDRLAIMVDLDGTLCLFTGNPYDRDFTADTVNAAVAGCVIAMRDEGYEIILMSGRDGKFRDQTEQWLADNGIPYHQLFMRNEGDKRKDNIVKRELYDTFVAPFYNVLFVLDDRPQVCRMWRAELGLTVFQVAENWEF
jgi:predicted kinase